MNYKEANKRIKKALHSDRWYLEERGNKIVFLEKLGNTYNLIYPITTPIGTYTNDIYDWHVNHCIEFVKHVRNPKDKKVWDVRGQNVSGINYDE